MMYRVLEYLYQEMSGGFGEAASSRPTQSSSFSNSNGSNNGDAGNFECNICLDIAQDPVVTLCGHLFCWPCLYKWLHMHSRSQECPICKAFIQEEKLVPLYGRGNSSTDLSSDIPHRPAGQRPEPDRNEFMQHGLDGSGLMGGIGPTMTLSFGNLTLSFGGFIPAIFNVQMQEFDGPPISGNARAPSYAYEGHHAHEVRQQRGHQHEASPLLIIGLIFLFSLIWG